MKLLIIEDDVTQAETLRALLHLIDKCGWKQVETIDLAANLAEATTLLWTLSPGDAVICDGRFPNGTGPLSANPQPPSPTPHGDWNTNPRSNWPHIAGIAAKIGVHFILYSGDPLAIERAQAARLQAFSKPTRAEELYWALIEAAKKRNVVAA